MKILESYKNSHITLLQDDYSFKEKLIREGKIDWDTFTTLIRSRWYNDFIFEVFKNNELKLFHKGNEFKVLNNKSLIGVADNLDFHIHVDFVKKINYEPNENHNIIHSFKLNLGKIIVYIKILKKYYTKSY